MLKYKEAAAEFDVPAAASVFIIIPLWLSFAG